MAKFYHPPNTHRARIMRVADGDTVLVLIEGLWGTWSEKYVRLAGIESYELDGPDAAKVKAVKVELNSLLEGRNVLVHLKKMAPIGTVGCAVESPWVIRTWPRCWLRRGLRGTARRKRAWRNTRWRGWRRTTEGV